MLPRLFLLSLFSGIGAFEKALDRLKVDYELVGYCEIDKYASKSYAAIHEVPESMNIGDITKVDEKALPKDIDLITYGFPCQDISLAGKQKGLFNEDGSQTRSGLFFDALRIIEETQPRVAIAENVKSLTGKKFNAQFQMVLDSLEAAGYNNYWQVLNAKDFGIPQNRERVFIVSIRKDIDTGCFYFPKGFPLTVKLADVLDGGKHNDFLSCVFTEKAVAAAYRGRYVESGKTKQMLEVSNREYANALTCVKKDSMVAFRGGCRYFTGIERFRLMDFDDEDFEKAEAVNSNTQLYKQAGNSIVVACPYYIFKALIKANIFIEKEKKEMELKMEQYQLPERISFNFEELKQELEAKVGIYETMVYTDDQIKEAKADKANLNKLKKALNDERIRREKEYMIPFNGFKSQVNEIIAIIDKPVAVIDKQVKAYEDKQKQDKLDAITAYFNGTEHPGWLHLSQIMDEKWVNASVSMKSVREAMDARLDGIEIDLTTLHDLPEFGFEAAEVYKTTFDINKAIAEGHRLSEIAKAKAAHEAEQARLKAEEEARKAAFQDDAVNPPVEEVAATEEVVVPPAEPVKQWVSFAAFVTPEQALALKSFFLERGIEFKTI